MSVKGHRDEGSSVVLMLRAGGEIVCEPAAIARITPDEVPYPEPEAPVESQPKTDATDNGPAVPLSVEIGSITLPGLQHRKC